MGDALKYLELPQANFTTGGVNMTLKV